MGLKRRRMITPHFFWDEFWQPARHGFPAEPYPEEWIEDRLKPLCDVLETLRLHLGEVPIRIISGYRSPDYNRKVGGAGRYFVGPGGRRRYVPTSQHVHGRAADIVVPGVDASHVHDVALAAHRAKEIKLGGLGVYSSFVHLDTRAGYLRRWRGK